MDEIFRNLKQKLSIENIVEFMKEAGLMSNDKVKEDVPESLDKRDSDKIVNVEEITTNLGEVAKKSLLKLDEPESRSKSEITPIKSTLSEIQKQTQQTNLTEEEEMAKHENIIAFYN